MDITYNYDINFHNAITLANNLSQIFFDREKLETVIKNHKQALVVLAETNPNEFFKQKRINNSAAKLIKGEINNQTAMDEYNKYENPVCDLLYYGPSIAGIQENLYRISIPDLELLIFFPWLGNHTIATNMSAMGYLNTLKHYMDVTSYNKLIDSCGEETLDYAIKTLFTPGEFSELKYMIFKSLTKIPGISKYISIAHKERFGGLHSRESYFGTVNKKVDSSKLSDHDRLITPIIMTANDITIIMLETLKTLILTEHINLVSFRFNEIIISSPEDIDTNKFSEHFKYNIQGLGNFNANVERIYNTTYDIDPNLYGGIVILN